MERRAAHQTSRAPAEGRSLGRRGLRAGSAAPPRRGPSSARAIAVLGLRAPLVANATYGLVEPPRREVLDHTAVLLHVSNSCDGMVPCRCVGRHGHFSCSCLALSRLLALLPSPASADSPCRARS